MASDTLNLRNIIIWFTVNLEFPKKTAEALKGTTCRSVEADKEKRYAEDFQHYFEQWKICVDCYRNRGGVYIYIFKIKCLTALVSYVNMFETYHKLGDSSIASNSILSAK